MKSEQERETGVHEIVTVEMFFAEICGAAEQEEDYLLELKRVQAQKR